MVLLKSGLHLTTVTEVLTLSRCALRRIVTSRCKSDPMNLSFTSEAKGTAYTATYQAEASRSSQQAVTRVNGSASSGQEYSRRDSHLKAKSEIVREEMTERTVQRLSEL